MATGPLDSVLRHIRRLAGGQAGDEASDGHLLKRFVSHRDEAAFAELVYRHGPVVWGVCRRMLHDSHLAEDAFQAAFLILVRKARSIGRPDRLGSWLYGVACRTAMKARTQAARHSVQPCEMADMASTDSTDPSRQELSAVLDEEVQRLPARYREPFLLCYVQGKTNSEAARHLGCPEGTIYSRLAWARDRLRGRLVSRGVALSAGSLVAVLSAKAALAAVPAALVTSTIQAAMLFAESSTTAAALVPRAVALTEGVLQTMRVTKLKTIAAVLALSVLAGSGLLAHHVLAAKADETVVQAGIQAEPPAVPKPAMTTKDQLT